MKCFVHAQADAVATCRNCHRGLCRECAVAEPGFIACRGACTEQARRMESLVANRLRSHHASHGNGWLAPAFFTTIAVILLYFGVQRFDERFNIATALGAAFLVYAGALFYRIRLWARVQR
jgi:hypothetical protein